MGVNSSCCQEEDLVDGPKEAPEVVDSYHGDGNCTPSSSSSAGAQEVADPSSLPALMSPATLDTLGTHPSRKWDRLQNMQHLEVDVDIVRGISLHASLRGLGHLWRRSPIDLPEEERRHLYERSSPVDAYDIFLSHTWQTPGRYKVLSLLFQAGWKHMLLWWFIGVVLAGLLSELRVLPLPLSIQPEFTEFHAHHCPFFPWCFIAAFVCSFMGLLLAPYFPNICGKRTMCFLDVVSIHQVDQELMERGIYGLGGFLRVSKELRVLWSAPYLSRLWCVFELAAYRKANPNGKTVLAPLFVEAGVLLSIFGTYFAAILFNVGFVMRWDSGEMRLFSYLFALTPIYVLMHLYRRTTMSKLKLLSDLHTFDVERADCRTNFDREFILRAITEWYGSKDAFTRYVRGPLRSELLGRRKEILPLQYLLIVSSVTFSASLDNIIALDQGMVPRYWVVAQAVSSCFGFYVCWFVMMLKLTIFLCDRFAAPWYPGALADYLQTFVLFGVGGGFYYAGAELCRRAYLAGLEASIAWASVAFLLSASSFFTDRMIANRLNDPLKTQAQF